LGNEGLDHLATVRLSNGLNRRFVIERRQRHIRPVLIVAPLQPLELGADLGALQELFLLGIAR
jgi:hypothetical protein